MTWITVLIVTLIFGVFVELILPYSAITICTAVLSGLSDIMSMSNTAFIGLFGADVVNYYTDYFLPLALALVVVLTIYGIVSSVMPETFGGAKENPLGVVVRGAVAVFMVGYALAIFNEIKGIFSSVLATLVSQDFPSASDLWSTTSAATLGLLNTDVADVIISDLSYSGILVSGIAGVVSFFIFVSLMWNLMQMMKRLACRYVLRGILELASPLPMAAFVLTGTKNITWGYIKMYVGNLITFILNIFLLRLYVSAVSLFIANGTHWADTTTLGYFGMYFMIMGLSSVSNDLERYISTAGLNTMGSFPASSGLLRAFTTATLIWRTGNMARNNYDRRKAVHEKEASRGKDGKDGGRDGRNSSTGQDGGAGQTGTPIPQGNPENREGAGTPGRPAAEDGVTAGAASKYLPDNPDAAKELSAATSILSSAESTKDWKAIQQALSATTPVGGFKAKVSGNGLTGDVSVGRNAKGIPVMSGTIQKGTGSKAGTISSRAVTANGKGINIAWSRGQAGPDGTAPVWRGSVSDADGNEIFNGTIDEVSGFCEENNIRFDGNLTATDDNGTHAIIPENRQDPTGNGQIPDNSVGAAGEDAGGAVHGITADGQDVNIAWSREEEGPDGAAPAWAGSISDADGNELFSGTADEVSKFCEENNIRFDNNGAEMDGGNIQPIIPESGPAFPENGQDFSENGQAFPENGQIPGAPGEAGQGAPDGASEPHGCADGFAAVRGSLDEMDKIQDGWDKGPAGASISFENATQEEVWQQARKNGINMAGTNLDMTTNDGTNVSFNAFGTVPNNDTFNAKFNNFTDEMAQNAHNVQKDGSAFNAYIPGEGNTRVWAVKTSPGLHEKDGRQVSGLYEHKNSDGSVELRQFTRHEAPPRSANAYKGPDNKWYVYDTARKGGIRDSDLPSYSVRGDKLTRTRSIDPSGRVVSKKANNSASNTAYNKGNNNKGSNKKK